LKLKENLNASPYDPQGNATTTPYDVMYLKRLLFLKAAID